MPDPPTSSADAVAVAAECLAQLVAAMEVLRDSGRAENLRSALVIGEGAARAIDATATRSVAVARRDGVFAAAGYRSDVSALSDLLRCDRGEARRRIAAADAVVEQVSLTDGVTPPRLPATAEAFAAGGMSRRHVEVLVEVLGSDAARRIPAEDWTAAEAHLAEVAPMYTPHQLDVLATDLVRTLDQDGPEPDDRAVPVNNLRIVRRRDGGGTLTGRFDDAAVFGTIVSVLDTHAAPTGAADERTAEQRQADALHDVCAFVHDHCATGPGNHRTQLIVTIDLADLEDRARRALLSSGDRLVPAQLRRFACDADVVPVVLNGDGQPIDVGRRQRVVSELLRRAVIARDRGCARPGCDRPPAWCEVHHVVPWELGGTTAVDNLVMLCRHHHRAVHHDGWDLAVSPSGKPLFRPPPWVDPTRTPLAA